MVKSKNKETDDESQKIFMVIKVIEIKKVKCTQLKEQTVTDCC